MRVEEDGVLCMRRRPSVPLIFQFRCVVISAENEYQGFG